MFTKILIANRGAIATRAERTIAKMGLKSVALYAEADKDSLHVAGADEAVYLGEGSAAATYLDQEKVLAAAKETGAQAIFPGYGFLSENADFARRCAAEGIAFIGPTPEQIERFGLKHVARALAKEAGVPLAPGTDLLNTLEEAQAAAAEIGFPLMLKSTAGGGGIGIRICRSAEQLEEAFEGARHLAEANFGNGGVFLERFVERGRHVEVQIFGANGQVVALGERDCSVQRRNQKVVEECPAPNLPQATREAMMASARKLAESIGYTNAGTVEFLYDEARDEFYFLEVNTRLQVEHGITEECCGVDLVEWMIKEAAGEPVDFAQAHAQQGHAIEVRLYAEDCGNNFLPATGKIDAVQFGEDARVETWIAKGIEVTSLFDPMLAKVIVHAETREEAVAAMQRVLAGTRVYGLTTNLMYLEALLATPGYQQAQLSTRMLDGFAPAEPTLEVLDGGVQTTVQSYPGIVGYWAVGVPPCGPMDSLSFRLGNALLGNAEDAAGLELTLRGGKYKFRTQTKFALTGSNMNAKLNGKPCPQFAAVQAQAGDVLELGVCEAGMRGYLCVEGGLDVAPVLGSRSTFVDGKMGGHGGRALRTGDLVRIDIVAAGAGALASKANAATAAVTAPSLPALPQPALPAFTNEWTIGVLVGPLSDEEFLAPEFLETLTTASYTVNYDSARTGVRLNGPTPQWTRADGGEAGLHPSNIHDNPYSICALDLTGDQPILLGPDGPSLGGFVCPVVVAVSERWKLGQLKPGDTVHFQVVSQPEAQAMNTAHEQGIAAVAAGQAQAAAQLWNLLPAQPCAFTPNDAILYQTGEGGEAICVRQSGLDALLVEYGPMKLDIALRFKAHVLMMELEKLQLPYIVDLTPGIRSLQVHYNPHAVSQAEVLQQVLATDAALPPLEDITVPSRIVHLPLSWDDPQTQLAARRYMETTRPDAPWCPSNLEFIRRINGLDSIQDVYDIFFSASYLVLGLGDVYLGAPVATPVDPRHRMVTTKYNPARPWTPENAVGIGGAYLCVYGMEGPGGYQFTGRTTQMWNPLRTTPVFKEGKPWLLDFFDQLQFYPVGADEILKLREQCLRGTFCPKIEETTFSLGEYRKFLEENAEGIAAFKRHQEASFEAEHQRWVEQGLDTFVPEEPKAAFTEEEAPAGCETVPSTMAGAVWKANAEAGEAVQEGQTILTLESMKMEFPIAAPCTGTLEKLLVNPGDLVTPGQAVAFIRTQAN
jgi:urea carboxylase